MQWSNSYCYFLYRHILESDDGLSKEREKIMLANINEKKAPLAILISNNTNLKAKSTVS